MNAVEESCKVLEFPGGKMGEPIFPMGTTLYHRLIE